MPAEDKQSGDKQSGDGPAEDKMREPAPYRSAEEVVREWTQHYGRLFPGQSPSAKWLCWKTRLGRTCVYEALKNEALKKSRQE